MGDNTFSYEFGTPHESCTAMPGSNPHTAKSGNRTKLTMNGRAITFCYDHADRLVSASDPSLTNVQYDSHGNTISLGDAAHKTEFTYDAADRNTAIRSDNKQTRYVRDAQDRILSRTHTQAGTPNTTTHYGFTGSGDTPDFTTDAAGNLTQKYLTLPGDVLVTITPNAQSAGATTFSLPNIHGDIFATINADGSLINTFMTGPFGEALSNQANPANTTPGTTYHYVGQHQKLTETNSSPIPGGIIQMGARVYLPILGRFLQVDPVEGGTDNNYVYANDPVNEFDLDGRAIPVFFLFGAVVRAVAPHVARAAVKYIAKPVARVVARKVIPLVKKATGQVAKWSVTGVRKFASGARKVWGGVKSFVSSVRHKIGNAARWWARNDPIFGYRRGVLNRGPNRIGYSKSGRNVAFRWGRPGSHNHRFNIRLPIRWNGYR